INRRQEKYEDVEIYTIDLSGVPRTPSPATAGANASAALAEPHRVTKNQAVEAHPVWASDSRHIFFGVEIGDVAGPYRDLQPHHRMVRHLQSHLACCSLTARGLRLLIAGPA